MPFTAKRQQKCLTSPTNFTNFSRNELLDLIDHMGRELDICDRTWWFHTYKCCFIGADCVTFFVENKYAKNRNQGVVLGKELLNSNLIQHVTNGRHFEDAYFYYRISVDDDKTGEFLTKSIKSTSSKKFKYRKKFKKMHSVDTVCNCINFLFKFMNVKLEFLVKKIENLY